MSFHGTHTQETRGRIAAKLRGIVRSDKTRAKIAASMLGKHLSAEHRLACRVGHRRTKLFDPERYAAIRAHLTKTRRRLWAAGVYDRRTSTSRGAVGAGVLRSEGRGADDEHDAPADG